MTAAPFFVHQPPYDRTGWFELPDVTRFMCAGAYLDDRFSDRTIAELTEDERRAVAPSVDSDVEPVLRHCFQARSLRLRRDAGLTAALLLGLYLAPLLTVAAVVLGALILVVRGVRALIRRRRRRGQSTIWPKVFAALALIYLVPPIIVGVFWSLLFSGVSPSTSLSGAELDGVAAPQVSGWGGPLLRTGVVLAVVIAVLTAYKLRFYQILTKDLRRGALLDRLPEAPNRRLEQRIARVSAAQWGNVTMHSGHSPFVGAGRVTSSWSMSLELRAHGLGRAKAEPKEIDVVRLHEYVRERLSRMRAAALPKRERVVGLMLLDHVVAAGQRELDELIEPDRRMPYAIASQDAIEGLIRHPQGRLRYYLRAVVGTAGRAVELGDRTVTRGQDQQITVSTFLYLAVEGGNLYAEFVATVLPSLNPGYLVIDQWRPERLRRRSFFESFPALFVDVPMAPVRLARSLWTIGTYGRKMERSDKASQAFRFYDYGARESARELATSDSDVSYIQSLDAEKYYKLLERVATSAILDFLHDADVDTTEYQTRANTVLNAGVIITGGHVGGPVAGGAGAVAVQQTG